MLSYILRRVMMMVPTLFLISIASFAIIQLPPGDMLTTCVASMEMTGEQVDRDRIDALRQRYGLDQPFYVQYWRWISGVVVGDFEHSFSLMPTQIPTRIQIQMPTPILTPIPIRIRIPEPATSRKFPAS